MDAPLIPPALEVQGPGPRADNQRLLLFLFAGANSSHYPSDVLQEADSRSGALLQGNTPAHKSRVAMMHTADCGFELLSHALYPLDLTPSDYYLFPHMKKHLHNHAFKEDEKTKDAVLEILEGFSTNFSQEGIAALHKNFENCVTRNSDYVEK